VARYIPAAIVTLNLLATVAITVAPWAWGK
jgi:hypothetical protein